MKAFYAVLSVLLVSPCPAALSASNTIPAAAATTSASLSTTFFDFGDDLVRNAIARTVVTVINTGTKPLIMAPDLSGNPSYAIRRDTSCGAELAAGRSCAMTVRYLPTVASAPKAQNALLKMHFANVASDTPEQVFITGMSGSLAAGIVTPTNNPQVALYTMTLPFPGKMTVEFGLTSSYGTRTWSQSTDTAGGQVGIFVAGMLQETTYHMAATVKFSNGMTAIDRDHSFTTGNVPADRDYPISVATAPGTTPQPGIELLNPITAVIVSNLNGIPLWTYLDPGSATNNSIYGVKMLPNSDFLMTIGELSQSVLAIPPPADAFLEIREVNLGGDTVKEISINDLNAELATATCTECGNLTLLTFHHDVTPLPNGHWLVLANTSMILSSTSNPPLKNRPAETILGDVIVDLDENLQPVWAWNEFNHFDPNVHPLGLPDWTHTNAILYSPDDGNILVSIRNLNWIVKVDYANGGGDGHIIWHLGEGGDFKLIGGTDPTDWQYAQHGPSFASENTSGVFSLAVMDNGDDRLYPTGSTCAPQGDLPASCLYTTVPIFKIDETKMTATLIYHRILPKNIYSSWGGNTEVLANGNVEYDDCATLTGSHVYEVTPGADARTVWQLRLGGLYRAFRIPSLYPGVQW
ncbi:MAG: aryl-sulfate sulfotransferase [Terracidiphilus sp.]